MPSRSTYYRHKIGDEINEIGVEAMVPCRPCQKKKLPCKISSLRKRCGNCVKSCCYECVPGDLPPVNFEKIRSEKARLRLMIAEAEKEDAEAVERSHRARARLARLKTQKRFLKEKEQKMLSDGLDAVEELDRLEAIEKMSEEISGLPIDESPVVAEAGASSVRVAPFVSLGSSDMVAEGGTFSSEESPILSSREHLPQGRLASEEIAAFDAFAAKMFPLPGLLDPDIVS